ncbi:hypothetical protein PsYK624_167290 [Phanerochaete sordida]|uniref:Uncharacterized protein n=1 Tax=Phanerochaete sordida TaxID=48140 RepID=A0A9P3GXB0_9APHY|nr:hypothetical protein PsYK624_167290 [Phanerochaete sordida]
MRNVFYGAALGTTSAEMGTQTVGGVGIVGVFCSYEYRYDDNDWVLDTTAMDCSLRCRHRRCSIELAL